MSSTWSNSAGCRRAPLAARWTELPHIPGAADRDIGKLGQQIDRLGGDVEQISDRRCVAARTQLARPLGGDAETTLAGQGVQDRGIFELGENVLMHDARSPDATTAIRLSVAPESRPLAVKQSVDTNMCSPLSSVSRSCSSRRGELMRRNRPASRRSDQ